VTWQPYFVHAIAEMDFGTLPSAPANLPTFPRAPFRVPVIFFANDGTGLRDLVAKLLRCDAQPFVMCLHLPSDRAFAIECYAETATSFSFTETELPLRDADWLRKVASIARRMFKLRAKCNS
jgi:hypothetical protein